MSADESKPEIEKETESVGLDWSIPESGVPEIYADWYQVNWMTNTIRIRLAQIIPDPKRSPTVAQWKINERAAVTMPYYTAKYLRDTLSRIIEAYEKDNGTINAGIVPSVTW